MQFNKTQVYRRNRLNGLGWITEALGAASAIMGSGSSGGGSAAPMMPTNANTNTVSPNINVSPQISPVFQQQFQPSNSAATAGTAQGAPSISSGSPDGSGFVPAPSGLGMPSAPSVPAIPQAPIDWNRYILYAGVALAGLAAVKLIVTKRAAPRRRRTVKK